MNFDQAFYSRLNKETEGGSVPPPTTSSNYLNNAVLVEQAWKEYQQAIDATKEAKAKVDKYKSNWLNELKKLTEYYTAQGNTSPVEAANAFMQNVLKELVQRFNDAVSYEEAKRQSYISISAANNTPTYSTVATQQMSAQAALNEAQAAVQNALNAASQATGLSTPMLIGIAAVVIIIILFFVLK